MFGKRNKGPSMEELIANLEYKMNIVEMLLERNERDSEVNLAMLKEMINEKQISNDDSFKKMEEKFNSLTEEVRCLNSRVDDNVRRIEETSINFGVMTDGLKANITNNHENITQLDNVIKNIESDTKQDISKIKLDCDSRFQNVGKVYLSIYELKS